MKNFLISLLLVVGLAVTADAQVFSGSYQQRFNEAQLIYYHGTATATTASDTLNFMSIAGASDLKLFGTGTDSTVVLVYYRLRNSTTGAVTAFTTMADTLGTAGAGVVTAAGPLALLERTAGSLALSTLVGFDEIQFYVDFLAGTAAGDDGGTNILRLYLFLVPTVR